jgi:GMP synthase (glutamine-hydrolysing)
MKRRAIIILIAAPILVLILGLHAGWAKENRRLPGFAVAKEAAAKGQRVWIVVDLFSNRASKQAIRVRDTLANLGAPGRGIVLPFYQVSVDTVERLDPVFMALSPNGIPWCRYKGRNGVDLANFFSALRVIVEQMDVPVVGICGGHQALALAFGGKVGPIRGGEDDCLPYRNDPPERGRKNVHVVMNDPIFIGTGPTLNLVQKHYDEVKRLPQGFVTLAGNDICAHQIIRHPTRPAYGIQAHSEFYFDSRPDGGLLLRNFLSIALTYDRLKRRSASHQRSRISSKNVRVGVLNKSFW